MLAVSSFSRVIIKDAGVKRLVVKFFFGKGGKGLGEFAAPMACIIKDDHLYVADANNHRLQILKINSNGSISAQSTFGKKGSSLGEFNCPVGLSIKDNYLFVSEKENYRLQILKINPDGTLIAQATFGKKGSNLGEFGEGIFGYGLIVKDNYLYVGDTGNNRIQVLKLEPDGTLTAQSAFGKEGEGLGEFKGFFGINLAAKDDYLFISDTGNYRIQVLNINPDGNLSPEFAFGKEGTGISEFGRFFGLPAPLGLCVERYLYVADLGNSRIQVFRINTDGSLTPKFASGNEGLGELFLPTSLAVRSNYLYVSDIGKNRILVFEIKRQKALGLVK